MDFEQASSTSQGTVSTWSDDGLATVTVTRGSIDEAITAGLLTLLTVARGGGVAVPLAPDGSPSLAAPIRGQGESYPDVFIELAGDLLAQVDATGSGLERVRLDGMLATDTGGYSAWGYALGESGGGAPAVGLNLVGTPEFRQADGEGTTTLTFQVRRS